MSTGAEIEEQRTGTELNVPECLATTPKMKEYAIDLVSNLANERQQFMLDLVQKRYDYPGDDEKLKLKNSIGFLKEMIRLDGKQDDDCVVVPQCFLDSSGNNKQRILDKISYLSVEEQQALLNYVDEKYQAALTLFNKENKMRWKKPTSLVAKNPEGLLMTIIENGIDEDEFKANNI